MSTKATDEPECESVADVQLGESSVKLETTVKPSDKFLEILNLSHTYHKEPGTFSKKQVKTMETKMEKLYDNVMKSENVSLDDILTLAHSYEVLSHAYISFNDKKHLSTAKYFNSRKLNLLKDKELHPKSILIALKTCYHLGYISFELQNFDKAIKSYDRGVELYFAYTQESKEYDIPIDIQDIIIKSPAVNGYEKLNILYTNLLKVAIEFHKSQLPGNVEYLIAYKHLLLVAQLRKLPKTKGYHDWIRSAAKLHHELVKQNRFTEARNHLTTAFLVKKTFFNDNDVRQVLSSSDVLKDYKVLTACITMSWITYGIRFLRTSATRLLRLQTDTANNNLKSTYPIKLMSHILQTLISFDEMKGNPFPNVFDHSMLVKSISGYNDAHKLFVHTLSQIKDMNFCLDVIKNIDLNMSLILDTSNVCKYMAFYEEGTSQILLQNRHVEILSKTVKNQLYSKQCVERLKNMQLQLAIGYSILIDTKLENFEGTVLVDMPQRYYAIMSEIENLVEDALMNLKTYQELVEL